MGVEEWIERKKQCKSYLCTFFYQFHEAIVRSNDTIKLREKLTQKRSRKKLPQRNCGNQILDCRLVNFLLVICPDSHY